MNRTDKRRRIAHVVAKVFGLSGLRPGQQAVIDAVLAGTHTLAIMPTGAGKSLCYQVPALLLPGTTVVVSPLIALMQDQFEKMSDLGIASVQVNSAIPRDEVRRAYKKIWGLRPQTPYTVARVLRRSSGRPEHCRGAGTPAIPAPLL